MLKLVLLLLLAASAASKLVGTEFVSPALQKRARSQQSDEDELDDNLPTGPLESEETVQEAEAPTLQENADSVFGTSDSTATAAGLASEGLSDAQVTEIQMLLALRDVVRLEGYIASVMEQLGKRIFGDLENTLLINKFTQTYGMYETILAVLQKYKDNKSILEAKARYLAKAINYSLDFITKTDDKFMQLIDDQDDEATREANKEVFVQVLSNLSKEVQEFSRAITDEMAEIFKGIDDTHRNPLKSDLQKIHELVDASLSLVVLKKSTLERRAESMLDIRKLVLDNPKYSEHLKKIQNDKIVLGGWAGRLLGALVGLVVAAVF